MSKFKTEAATATESDFAQLPTVSRIVLSRVQFRDVIDLPAIDGRTVWLDHENRTFSEFEFIYDLVRGLVVLEKPKDPSWVPVMVPLSNVAAMFPAKEETS